MPLSPGGQGARPGGNCPSALPTTEGAAAFGVIAGTVDEPQVRYFDTLLPATTDLLARAAPLQPAEVFRFTAPCARDACQHFVSERCSLADRVVSLLPSAIDTLPPCAIRRSCKWWAQHGRQACNRCPSIVTETTTSDERRITAADPPPRSGPEPRSSSSSPS